MLRGKGWGGKDWEFGISTNKLLYIGWINNQGLPYSTGSYIQYPVVNHSGKEYLKERMYAYIYTESVTAEINATL